MDKDIRMSDSQAIQSLADFNNTHFERGASTGKEIIWLWLRGAFFDRSLMPWFSLRRTILKGFGAKVANGVVIKPGAKITFPWKLEIGRDAWIGEESWLLNLDNITIGNNVCISQRAVLCTGSHDWSKPTFDLITKPIVIGEGVWICANVFVGPGVTVGRNTVVTAGSVVTRDLPPDTICSGNPCIPVKDRQSYSMTV